MAFGYVPFHCSFLFLRHSVFLLGPEVFPTHSSDVGLPAPLESATEEISEIEDLIEG
jgi:hypothetical protein